MNRDPEHPHRHDALRSELLDDHWTRDRLERARALLSAIDGDAELAQTLDGYDRLRGALSADGEPSAEEDAAARRLAACLRGQAVDRPAAAPAARGRGAILATIAGSVLSTAAALAALAWLTGVVSFTATRHTSPGPLASAQHASPAGDAVGDDPVQAFTDVQQALDGRTGWLAMSPNQTWVGVANSTESVRGAPLHVLGVSITHGDKPAGALKLVLRPGQTADLTLPLAGGASVRLKVASDTIGAPTVALTLRDAAGRHADASLSPPADDPRPGVVSVLGYRARITQHTTPVPTSRTPADPPRSQPGRAL